MYLLRQKFWRSKYIITVQKTCRPRCLAGTISVNQCPRQNAFQPNSTLLTSTNNDDWRWLVSDGSIFVVCSLAPLEISASEGHGANASEGPIGCCAGKPWGSQNAGGRCGHPAGDSKRERSESTMLPLVLEVQIYVFCFNWFCMFRAMTLLYFTAIQKNVQGALSASAWWRGKEGTVGASRMKFRVSVVVTWCPAGDTASWALFI